ncbi:MAG TPA: hypothetical protein VJZ27_09405 [Aggregatilineales bacterium]|nr:hypothetical protein [Aggregatilineales bacterium]
MTDSSRRTPSAFARFMQWYRRIGAPVEFYSPLSYEACIKKLRAETVSWETRNPFGLKKYKSLIESNGQFKLKNRRIFTEPPFEGKLERTPDGGTWVTGQVVNVTSYPGFVAFLMVVAPVAGGLTYGRVGWIGGLIIALLFVAAGLYARFVEEKSHTAQAIHDWLRSMLQGTPKVIDMEPVRRRLNAPKE